MSDFRARILSHLFFQSAGTFDDMEETKGTNYERTRASSGVGAKGVASRFENMARAGEEEAKRRADEERQKREARERSEREKQERDEKARQQQYEEQEKLAREAEAATAPEPAARDSGEPVSWGNERVRWEEKWCMRL